MITDHRQEYGTHWENGNAFERHQLSGIFFIYVVSKTSFSVLSEFCPLSQYYSKLCVVLQVLGEIKDIYFSDSSFDSSDHELQVSTIKIILLLYL